MAIEIKTIKDLKAIFITELIAAFNGELGIVDNQGQISLIAGSIEDALAAADAGSVAGNYALLQHISLQATPVTATLNSDTDPWGTLQDWGIAFNSPIKVATGSEGTIDITFTDIDTVPAGTQLKANDDTIVETTTEIISSGAEVINTPIISQEVGADTNLLAGDQLSLISPINNVDSAVVGASGMTGGQDDETQEPFRARVLIAIRAHSIGSQEDRYEVAALSAPGVTRVFVDPREPSVGSVTIRFMMDEVRAPTGIPIGTDGIIPLIESLGDQLLVEQAIIDAKIRPPAATVYISAPIAKFVDIELTNLTPDTADVRSAIEVEIADFFKRSMIPGSTLQPSNLSAAISSVQLEDSHELTVPINPVASLPGELLLPGNITYA